ncbi:MAG TPA: hypothetical protein VMU41_17920 [Candidatus Binataceae bacterium]|nr:hypothetical protein [Candidatus Binataceae bacterium]
MIDPIWNNSTCAGGDATPAPAALARVWRGCIPCAYLDSKAHSDKVHMTLFDPYMHQPWDESPNYSGARSRYRT